MLGCKGLTTRLKYIEIAASLSLRRSLQVFKSYVVVVSPPVLYAVRGSLHMSRTFTQTEKTNVMMPREAMDTLS